MDEKRIKVLSADVTPSTFDAFKQLAKDKDLSISKLLNRLIVAYLAVNTPKTQVVEAPTPIAQVEAQTPVQTN